MCDRVPWICTYTKRAFSAEKRRSVENRDSRKCVDSNLRAAEIIDNLDPVWSRIRKFVLE